MNPDALIEAAKSESKFYEIIANTKFATRKKAQEKLYTESERISILERMKEQAGDFSGRDIQTMVTVQELAKIINVIKKRVPGISRQDIDAIIRDTHIKVEDLKKTSYLMRNDRNSNDNIIHGRISNRDLYS